LENLPNGPAVLVYYHGAFPIDYYLFVLRIYRLTGKLIYSVIDHVIFHFPGTSLFLSIHHTGHPTREKCINILKQGHLMGVAPGGVREQNYGNNYYKLIWGKRKGFAQVAIDAKVTQRAIEALRDKHQKIPGSILHALRQRFETRKQ
uniref:Phospholipid/glycerol acyltransferase domain-containing protein n=1 Tax=Naja naja TaxID=35670 RepID=A0A8C7E6B3_NAJNA